MYTEQEIVRIAKREHNTKRNYLVVNQYQGKHVPISPSVSLRMFQELAFQLKDCYPKERLLLIGFAETATAIGAAVAIELHTLYMQTTREEIAGATYLYFSESHSHATEQKLVREDIERVIEDIDRIIFIEDEVTTGNTILHIVNLLEKLYPNKVQFSVASILNGMNQEAEQVYAERNIALHYVIKTNHESYAQIVQAYDCNGTYEQKKFFTSPTFPKTDFLKIKDMTYHAKTNPRRCVKATDFLQDCENLWKQFSDTFDLENIRNAEKTARILVLGTEEFMYPSLYIGAKLEEQGFRVWSHATTRSPIEVSKDLAYPLHKRYELTSLYEDTRTTYIYDLETYDFVLIVTDAAMNESINQEQGLQTLLYALQSCGNENIQLVRWWAK